jgi:ABC-2 type transport system permease protein
MLGLLSASFVGFGLINDMREGVIERFRVTPLNPLAVPLGMTLRDVLILSIQSFLVMLVAWPFGLNVSLPVLALMVVVLALLGLMASSISYALALSFMNENVMASMINMVVLPLTLLSGITLPLAVAPEWMRTVALFNPLAHVVEAARAVFNNSYGDSVVLRGIVVLVVCSGLALFWAARAFRRAV